MRLRHDEDVVRSVAAFRDWLQEWLPEDFQERTATYHHDLGFRREYQRAAFAAGWLVPEWEPDLGGHGLDRHSALAVRTEGARMRVPKVPSVQSVGVVAPALRRFGTDAQRERHLVAALRGDEDWCLGMSEPEAGSDLASMTTAAVPDGTGYIVNGAKIWTTQADSSRWCLLFCRTEPAGEKPHRGISCLVVDMASPGITVRPIPVSDPRFDPFCEVRFDDVRVPGDAVIGERGAGWKVAMESLAFERDMIWIMNAVEIHGAIARATRLATAAGPDADDWTDIGRLASDALALELSGLRGAAAPGDGATSDVVPTLKLMGSEALQRAIDLLVSVGGLGALADPEHVGALIMDDLESRASAIYGGTSEIHRNIIGEKVLGLPR